MKIRRDLNEFRKLTKAKFSIVSNQIRGVQKALEDLDKTFEDGFDKLAKGLGEMEENVSDIKKRLDDAGL